MVVLIACAVLGLSMAGARETCKYDTLDEGEDDCEFVLVGEEGAGAKYLVIRGGGLEVGAEVARGGGWSRAGGEVEHVPDCEWPFRGQGLQLRLARGSAFQR